MSYKLNAVRRTIWAGATALALLLQGCTTMSEMADRVRGSGDETSAPPLVISGAEMALELAPVHIAARKLYGEDVEIPNGGVSQIVGDDAIADVAANAESPALRWSLEDPDVRFIMSVAEGHYNIVARKSAGINSVADLKGKRVISYPGSTAGYFLKLMLEREGLTIDDVEVISDYLLGEIAPAMAAGEADATALWEPDSMSSLTVLGDDGIMFSGEGVFYEHYSFYAKADDLENPEKRREIVRLLRAIIDATEEINNDADVRLRAQKIVTESGGLYTLEEIIDAWPYVKFVASFDDGLLDVLEDEEKYIAETVGREARSREELAKLIDRSVYEEAIAGR